MSENEAIDLVVDELGSGTALYVFKPMDVTEKFFIGETIMTAAAAVFIAAFVKGINTALEKRGKELGETVGKWFVDKLEGLFRKPKDAKDEGDKLKQDIKEMSESGSKLDKKTKENILNDTEKVIIKKMVERGISTKKAEKIAKQARIGAETLLAGD